MSTPRIPPRPTEDWTDEVDEAFLALRNHGSKPAPPPPPGAPVRPKANILGIYAWHPALAGPWLHFSNHLRHSTLSDRVREMIIIRVTWLGYGEYEWAQHVRMSLASGDLSKEEVDALSEGPGAALWNEQDAAVVRAIDEQVTEKNVSDATWAALEKQFSRQQLIDFVFTVGTYDMHCTAFKVFGLQLEEGMTGFPDSHRPA